MNCRGCGVELDPSEEQVHTAVDRILETSLRDAKKKGGVCPPCGTPHGHWIRFGYDDLSRIKRAEDDAGHWAKYEYNGDGVLKTATLSSGWQRNYDYDGALMTRISDEKGHVLLRNSYDRRILTRQQFGNGATYFVRLSLGSQWLRGQGCGDAARPRKAGCQCCRRGSGIHQEPSIGRFCAHGGKQCSRHIPI
jgi:uncharacterized protein RhaS with RHS repeats